MMATVKKQPSRQQQLPPETREDAPVVFQRDQIKDHMFECELGAGVH